MRRSAVPARPRLYAFAAVAIAAVIVRLIYLQELDQSPLSAALMGDARIYHAWAQRIAAGEWIGTDVFYQTPLYPYALAIVYSVGGADPALVKTLQALLGAAACVLIGLTGRRLFGARAGLIAAGILAVYPPAIFFDGLIQKSSLDLFLITVLLFAVARYQDEERTGTLAAAGLATGALILNRENAFALVPAIAVWLLLRVHGVRMRARAVPAGVYLACVCLVLSPVALRNYAVSGELVVSTSQLGPNFYIGNNPAASGSYESLLPGRGDPVFEREDATALASKAAGRQLSPREVSAYWMEQALAFIRAEPVRWLSLTGKKLLLAVHAAEISDTESLEAYGEWAPLLRGLSFLSFGVILPLAVCGIWAHRHAWRRLTVFYAVAAALWFATALFYVVARYRYPLVPIVILFAGAGVDALLRIRNEGRSWIPGVVAAALVAIAVHVPMTVVHDQTFINLGGFLLDNGRTAEAVPVLRRAVTVDPEDPIAQGQLGLALARTGQTADAVGPLRAAARLQPDSAAMHVNLGLVLMDSGEAQYPEALRHFEEAARLAPEVYSIRMNFGGALVRAGRVDEGVVQYREASRRMPDSVDPAFFSARAYAQEGRLPEALASLEQALVIAQRTGQTARAAELAETIGHTKAAMR